MAAKASRRLVIDTSVTSVVGGEEATYPASKNCRDFLIAVLKICHRIVMTPEILDEWNRHRSTFARKWLVSMEARKKVYRLDYVVDDGFREKIVKAARKERDAETMLKDCFLIEAARATDGTIVSRDEEARQLFAASSQKVGELKNVAWINPEKMEEQPIVWLEKGATPEKQRRLGFRRGKKQ